MKSWKLSVPGSGLGGDVLNWIPSAKAVSSSRANELEELRIRFGLSKPEGLSSNKRRTC